MERKSELSNEKVRSLKIEKLSKKISKYLTKLAHSYSEKKRKCMKQKIRRLFHEYNLLIMEAYKSD